MCCLSMHLYFLFKASLSVKIVKLNKFMSRDLQHTDLEFGYLDCVPGKTSFWMFVYVNENPNQHLSNQQTSDNLREISVCFKAVLINTVKGKYCCLSHTWHYCQLFSLPEQLLSTFPPSDVLGFFLIFVISHYALRNVIPASPPPSPLN